MKKFFGEFKTFITRGNVVDMAVGVTVGSAFTAIVNGLSNYILKPLINFILALILGEDSLSGIVTPLKAVYIVDELGVSTGELDLTQSIYIDWGAFINAVINFFIIAFVLFCIVRVINRLRAGTEKLKEGKISKEDRLAIKAEGIKLRDKEAVAAYFARKAEKEAAEAAAAAAAAEEAARIAKENSTEELLKQILAELKKKG